MTNELEYPCQIIWYWGHAAKFGKLVHINEIQSKAKIPHLKLSNVLAIRWLNDYLMTEVLFHSMIIRYNCQIKSYHIILDYLNVYAVCTIRYCSESIVNSRILW